MKYSYNWLKELSDTKLSPEKSAEILTMHSFELEGMEKREWNFDGVVVGLILEIRKHPNADKLQLAKVDIGKKVLDIVCGAKNIEVGQKVPVATVGTKLPNGIEIREAEIRGEKSCGMLCALDELGLGTDHSGIFILDKKAKIGEPAKKYLGLEDDVIFEIKVLPDRAHDAMSYVGVAREMAVLEGKKFAYDFEGLKLTNKKSKILKVEIKDKKLCPRYIGAVMENVEIKDSPAWMKVRLEASGIRPINNVVDATNYVMLELGQPMHAFDAEKISSKNKTQIIIRKANKNEKMILLDDSELILNENDLLIANSETPLALAGIMGGKESGINENTKTIILEAANFNAVNIRRSRTRLGVKTESSDRFEKDIDPNLAEKAMVRIIEILGHTANAKLEGVVDIYPNKIKPWKVKLNLEYANSLLGEKVSQKEIIKILNLLNIENKEVKSQKSKVKNLKVLECIIPTFRLDLRTQEDLIEEIGRIWGYENIDPRPLIEPIIPARKNLILFFERKLTDAVISLGFDEMYNYSFYSQFDAKNCFLGDTKHFELANPMNPDQQFLRTNLVPNILKNIKTNLKNFEEFGIFEMGKIYFLEKEEVVENRILAMAQVLEKDPVNLTEAKNGASKNAETFYKLKGIAENLLEKIGVSEDAVIFEESKISKNQLKHPTRSAEIRIDDIKVGSIFEINPIVLGKYKIEKRVAICEFDTEKLMEASRKEIAFKQLQKFPTVMRDISMLAKNETKAIDIQNLIKKIGGELVLNVKLFDVFKKDNQTSFAYHIEFGMSERTLESIEVDEVMKKIVSDLEKELNIEVRK